MHACAGHGFIQIHQLFAVAEGIQNRGHRADVQCVRTDAHQVVQDTRYFGEHGADVFGADGDFQSEQFFHGKAISLLVHHHGNVVQAVHIRQGLQVGFGFSQFFRAAVQQADMRVGADDLFALQFQNHAQYAVGGGVLRAEVDGVVSEFSHRSSPRGQRAA